MHTRAANQRDAISEGDRAAAARAAYERSAGVAGFDHTEVAETCLSRPERYRQLFAALSAPQVISRGAGLNYCLASASRDGHSVLSTQFDRFLGFDEETGVVRVEPGVTLGALFEFAVARNLLPPVLPGYPLITAGGAVAMNIHGKNQFRAGNFGDHVHGLTLYHPGKGEFLCGPNVNADLFRLTVGGFGLTGHITSVDIALAPLPGTQAVIERHTVPNLVEAGHLMEKVSGDCEYTYSWHNLNLRGKNFGAGTVYTERHSGGGAAMARRDVSPSAMKPLPFRAYNRLTVPLLCSGYQVKERLSLRKMTCGLFRAFFPFVGKELYFRMYGRKGFREYQALFPRERWDEACGRVAEAVGRSGALIMLASIKVFRGERKLLNFSGEGICLALDTPNTPAADRLFSLLDEITVELGGLANISKDGRLSAASVRRMYGGQYDEFRDKLRNYDPEQRFQSELRRRLDV